MLEHGDDNLDIGFYGFDEDLIAQADKQRLPGVEVYTHDRSFIVLGRSSKPDIELHLDACQEDNIPVLRRRGGGCSVLIDPGNVIVSTAVPVQGLGDINKRFAILSQWLIRGLSALGVYHLKQRGISDLTLGDRKIAGSCLYLSGRVLYYSSTLLVEPDVEGMERYLKHPPREPGYRKGRRHGEFVGNLSRVCGLEDVSAFLKKLSEVLQPPIID